ncbi:MAG TPA: hypothetical protein VHJ00_04140 [Bradyrhizobium sp.]|jgi:hypothetical protein|nr:hypothetical protein [Bradyrhizobium sp.]
MNGTKVLGLGVLSLAAVGAMLVIAAPAERAQAASLISPGAAATVQQDARQAMTTEVHWHWRRHHHWRHWHHRHHRRW